ncbi:proteasome subunit beta type [Striga asiatica]|uniref:Proteasome subunit beta type n=1 Tax=Striga asiatica TaxID=4170 RepID=A0A5A7PSG7_STRAF|nr:proteasome subunit beta type [Striga asiatica]
MAIFQLFLLFQFADFFCFCSSDLDPLKARIMIHQPLVPAVVTTPVVDCGAPASWTTDDDHLSLPDAEDLRDAKKPRLVPHLPEEDEEPRYPKRDKGTTTLGIIYKEGVMVGSDHSNASNDGSEFVDNVIDLDSHMLVSVSGVGEPKSFLRNMKEQFQALKGRKSISEVSEWVANHLSSHCDKDPSAKMLIAAWDNEIKRPALVAVNFEGERFRKRLLAGTGAGSNFVRGLYERRFQEMGCAEASENAEELIRFTVSSLARSALIGDDNAEYGGYVTGYYVGAEGVKRTFRDVPVGVQYFFEAIGAKFYIW